MKPGEIITAPGMLTLNAGRETLELEISNTGDRPIQVGSHYHFYETNEGLSFDREAARGFRLDIPAGNGCPVRARSDPVGAACRLCRRPDRQRF